MSKSLSQPSPSAVHGYPNLGVGVGLRAVHYDHILETEPAIDWLEVLSDNYLATRGRPLEFLDRISKRYPVAMHGVGLSIGSTDALDREYVKQLKELRVRCGAHWVSDHFAWTGVCGINGHDLFPLPYTEECLKHVIERVHATQELLGDTLILENPSTYLQFAGATLDEASFIREVIRATGAGLLLDVNNIYVNSRNHGFNARDYLSALPLERVVQFHVAGHTVVDEPLGETGPRSYLIDTHSDYACEEVWDLLGFAVSSGARASVLIEWDADIPDFSVLLGEAERAKSVVQRALEVAQCAE